MIIYRKSIGRQPAVLAAKEQPSRQSPPLMSSDLVQLAVSAPANSTPEAILRVQRLVGNRAMNRLISTITRPGTQSPAFIQPKFVSDSSEGAPPAIQAKWIDDDAKKDRQKWDSVQNGIQWYKEGSSYSYKIVDKEKIPQENRQDILDFEGDSYIIEAWPTMIGFGPPVEEEKKEEIEQVKQELKETKQEEKISQIEWAYEHDEQFVRKIIKICKESKVGGLCTAWVIDWWQKKLAGKEPSKRYTDEELKELVKKQQEYYKAENLVAYGKKEGYDLEHVGGGRIGYSGELSKVKKVTLENGTGYLLDLQPHERVGVNIGHSIALFKEKDGLTFMDQNRGQGKVADFKTYASEMVPYFSELYNGEEELRWWSLYKLIPQNIK